MKIEKIISRHIDPINFERPLSRAYWYSKKWNRELPESVRLNSGGLRAMNRTLEPQGIEEASRAVLEGLCEIAHAVVDISSVRTLKKQHKGFIAYADNIWDRTFEEPLHRHTRLHKQPKLVTRSGPKAVSAQDVLRDLESMLKEQDEPDFLHRPTAYAYDIARQIIENSYTHYLGSSPSPVFAPDGEGGIIAEWKSGQRVVRLIVGCRENERTYVYSRGNDQSLIDHSASGSVLAQRLSAIFVN